MPCDRARMHGMDASLRWHDEKTTHPSGSSTSLRLSGGGIIGEL